MKASRFGIRILREFPKDAEAPSHKWLVRSGYIIQHGSGIYSYTPLFFRVFRKICAIVEQEMTAIGAQQVQLPLLQPARLWERSGRWEVFRRSRLMFQLTDRKDSQYGLTPTAEEMMCEFAKSLITTRKDVPLTFFQQHVKFRDELRPRFGLVRSREFTMMDAYSFDCDDAGMDAVYRAMRGAYQAVFTRCALKFAIVLADSGAMGGSGSEEFMALSDWGEDTILYTDHYAANAELAQSRVEPDVAEPPRPAREVSTPNAVSADDVAAQLGISLRQIVKTLVYEVAAASGEDQLVAVLLRGDRSINLVKLQNHLGGIDAKLAAADKVTAIFGAEPGSIGPVGLRGRIRHRRQQDRMASGRRQYRPGFPSRRLRGSATRRGRRQRARRGHAQRRAWNRGRTHLQARRQIYQGVRTDGAGQRQQAGAAADGVLRNRHLAGGRRHRRAMA
jgi:prolyl-tRNA synthetase